MPYCPKCDMEFIDGITVCSDCGGPLVESKAVSDAMKKKEQEEALARLRSEAELLAEFAPPESLSDFEEDSSSSSESKTMDSRNGQKEQKNSRQGFPAHLYVKKSEQYDDMKSSGSAFLLLGGCLTVFALLCWLNVIPFHFGIISRLAITACGIGALAVSFKTFHDAKAVRGQIHDEEEKNQRIINWFIDTYTGTRLDEQLMSEYGELLPEEQSLKRFELIQDLLITSHDLTDQSYVDLLTDEIYEKLYQD